MFKAIFKNGLTGLLATSVFLFIYLTVKIYLIRRKYRHIPGPKTNGILGYYLGNLLEIKKHVAKGKLSGDLLLDYLLKYGPIFKYQVLSNILVVVADPTALKEILIDHDFHKEINSYRMFGFPFNKRGIGHSLASLIDKQKSRHRRLLYNHKFGFSSLMSSISVFNYTADMLMEKLRKHANGRDVVTLFDEFNSLTLDVISDVAFSTNINCMNDSDSVFVRGVDKTLEYISLSFNSPFLKLNPFGRKRVHDHESSIDKFRDASRQIILQRMNDLNNNEHVPDDILTTIIKEKSMDLEEKVDEFVMFFGAGGETTAIAISFAIFELAQNPQVLEKLTTEIEQVIGNKPFIDSNDLAKLEYTTCVFNEAMRKWPPFPHFARENYQDLTVTSYVSSRNPKYFPDPEKFIPERFLSSSEISKQNRINNYTYFPFSVGPRNCLGQNFARIEGKIILAKFIQNFNYKLDESQSMKVKSNLSIRLKDGCKVTLTLKD